MSLQWRDNYNPALIRTTTARDATHSIATARFSQTFTNPTNASQQSPPRCLVLDFVAETVVSGVHQKHLRTQSHLHLTHPPAVESLRSMAPRLVARTRLLDLKVDQEQTVMLVKPLSLQQQFLEIRQERVLDHF